MYIITVSRTKKSHKPLCVHGGAGTQLHFCVSSATAEQTAMKVTPVCLQRRRGDGVLIEADHYMGVFNHKRRGFDWIEQCVLLCCCRFLVFLLTTGRKR